ncbi:SUMF1/EgtB/PvdO family nonheme iron enzyme [Pontibacter sp. G13]|uniref:SUMF1/EgtB/PvdO family nonheme iron enzyme n=1 Tax=Pontibacter sp. G13 TaxID=3074898 RepID=UPI00288972B9|nr:SUMF1/EgtB/PvdO family nonheme iron enzyme [Pontibacter sp. G13]WNJ21285.1 SUMF1/EgtB/PvdO family nonheme iron enzyme [Pontibacter sp. G13]
MNKRSFTFTLATLLVCGLLVGCSSHKDKINRVGKRSSKTGIKYNEETYKPPKYKEPKPAPGLVLIPGGTFMMGGGEKDIENNMDNRQRQVTVQSFYMDETEVANVDWKEFVYYIQKNEGDTKYKELLPDTNVWRRDLAYNDPYAETYFAHTSFNMYPVVGVNWHQANDYCKWRTERVNEMLLEKDEEAQLYPSYRLPTEAEWEYAARGLLESEIYAWEGKSLRNRKGVFRANFKPGRGNYAGWRGGDGRHMTDGYMITAPVMEFWPNDFGLYNMSGNVAEWTQDNYRRLAFEDVSDFNPYRRKGKTEIRPDDWLDDVSYKAKESLLFNPDPNAPVGNDGFDNVKVYRGGSWADIAYYLSPGVRRYFNADSSSATIGFRCAMIRVGSPD